MFCLKINVASFLVFMTTLQKKHNQHQTLPRRFKPISELDIECYD